MTGFTEEQQEDIKSLQRIITEIRYAVTPYLQARNINYNAEQLIEFMMTVPIILGVWLDEEIDAFEKNVLDHTAKFASRYFNEQLNEDTQEMFRGMVNPDDAMNDTNFVQDLRQELDIVLGNFKDWQEPLTRGLKSFLEMEDILKKYNPFLKSLRDYIIETLYTIMLRNTGDNKIETTRIQEILAKLGIFTSKEQIEHITQSVK